MEQDVLSKKKIVIGVTGGIAAYKSCFLIRELIKRNAKVKVVMTPSAVQFISPLTFSSLSKNEVVIDIFPSSQKKGTDLSTWHIDLALWADILIITPATINTIAKIAHGFADNALTAFVTAMRNPVIICPTADAFMYNSKAAQLNINKLKQLGFVILNAEEGELASGITGKGRMPDVQKIIDKAEIVLSGINEDLIGKKFLISAGPTYEDIDPVRFIGNRSSGKMGFEIAKAAYLRGADVILISGPTYLNIYPEIKLIKIRSAAEMKKEIEKNIEYSDALIMAAAVADFKPKSLSKKKIKKQNQLNSIELVQTEDILASLKNKNKTIAGFALETENGLANAKRKLKEKNLAMIVLNELNKKGSGFEFDTNQVTIITKNGKKIEIPMQSKFQIANKILNQLIEIL